MTRMEAWRLKNEWRKDYRSDMTNVEAERCNKIVGVVQCHNAAVFTAVCPDCGEHPRPRTYSRCEEHGGEEGAKRALKSHRGLYHPKAKP